MEEKTLSSELIYKGKIISVRCDKVKLSDGRISNREIVDHSPAVVIIAIDEQDRICFVKQYRKPVESVLIELPAGCVDADEDILAAAKRELKEECGCIAKQWTTLQRLYPTPGFCNEEYCFFLAEDISFGSQSLDEDEAVDSVDSVDSVDCKGTELNVFSLYDGGPCACKSSTYTSSFNKPKYNGSI